MDYIGLYIYVENSFGYVNLRIGDQYHVLLDDGIAILMTERDILNTMGL